MHDWIFVMATGIQHLQIYLENNAHNYTNHWNNTFKK